MAEPERISSHVAEWHVCKTVKIIELGKAKTQARLTQNKDGILSCPEELERLAPLKAQNTA